MEREAFNQKQIQQKSISQAKEIASKMAKASSNHEPLPAKLELAWTYVSRVRVTLQNIAFEDEKTTCLSWLRVLARFTIGSLRLKARENTACSSAMDKSFSYTD
jgi:hypothetical protein